MKKIVGYILGVLGLCGVDWFTKYLAYAHLGDRRIPIISEFLQLRYVVNTGLSFSSFAGNKVVTTLIPVVLKAWAKEVKRGHADKLGELKVIICGAAEGDAETLNAFAESGIKRFGL